MGLLFYWLENMLENEGVKYVIEIFEDDINFDDYNDDEVDMDDSNNYYRWRDVDGDERMGM